MKLASCVHPSKEWPKSDYLAMEEEPKGTYTVLCAEYGLGSRCECWYQGPSLFRALLAYARIVEFSDTNARYCAYLDSVPVSGTGSQFVAAWNAAGQKCLTRGAQRCARIRARVENDVEEGAVAG